MLLFGIMKINLFLLMSFLIVLSCNASEKNKEISNFASSKISLNTLFQRSNAKKVKAYTSKVLKIKNVLINGNRVILTKEKFDSIYKDINSTKTSVWECGNPFETLDEKWMTKTYGEKNKESGIYDKFDGNITTIFGKDIEFTTNNNIVLFDKASAKNNSFEIISHKITLNKNTTLNYFRKAFPNSEMETLDEKNEVRFRLLLDKNDEDAFLFYFKDGKLDSFTLWWVLC
jgi:hypothetical protein